MWFYRSENFHPAGHYLNGMEAMVHTFKLGPKDVEQISAAPNEPHHHEFEELIIGAAGTLEHFIDFRSETIDAPFIGFVTKGKVHRVRPRAKDGLCDITVIRFRSEFIPETIFQLYSLFHDQAQMAMRDGRCFARLTTVADMIVEEMGRSAPDLAVVRQLLGTLFTLIRSEHRAHHPDASLLSGTYDETFRNFLRILEENYRQAHDVEFYASQLFMSPRNLNLITQDILQQSVSRI
ncbi:MAG TPA: hypothetical protein VKG92_00770, partial [Flavobacteriales bacterium]|nr:hypothetical protein [Flavobacteriales bacterium]